MKKKPPTFFIIFRWWGKLIRWWDYHGYEVLERREGRKVLMLASLVETRESNGKKWKGIGEILLGRLIWNLIEDWIFYFKQWKYGNTSLPRPTTRRDSERRGEREMTQITTQPSTTTSAASTNGGNHHPQPPPSSSSLQRQQEEQDQQQIALENGIGSGVGSPSSFESQRLPEMNSISHPPPSLTAPYFSKN